MSAPPTNSEIDAAVPASGPLRPKTANTNAVLKAMSAAISTAQNDIDTGALNTALAAMAGGDASQLVGLGKATLSALLGNPSNIAAVRQAVSLDNYGAVGDWNGTTGTNDYAAIRNAITDAAAAKLPLVIPGREFYIGSFGSHGVVYNITGIPGIIAYTGAKIVLTTTANVTPLVFVLDMANGFRVSGDLTFEDTGFDPAIDWRGAYGLVINPTVGDCTNLDLTVKGKNMVGTLLFRLMTYEIRNVRLQVEFDNVYYGFVAQSCGDNVIGQIRGRRARRSYFVHGVQNHKIQLIHKDPGEAQSDIVIKQYARQLQNVEVDAIIEGTDVGHANRLRIEIESDGAATMRDVCVRLEQREVVPIVGVIFSLYTAATAVDTSATKKFENIRITSRYLGFDPIFTVSGVPAENIVVDIDEPTLQALILYDSFPADYITFRSGDALVMQVRSNGVGLNTKVIKFDLRQLNSKAIHCELTVFAQDNNDIIATQTSTLSKFSILAYCIAGAAGITGPPVEYGKVFNSSAATTTIGVTGPYLTVKTSYTGTNGRLFARLRIA